MIRVEEIRARAEDVIANRRDSDCCNIGECFYPAVIQAAGETLGLLAVVDQLAEALTEWANRYGDNATAATLGTLTDADASALAVAETRLLELSVLSRVGGGQASEAVKEA